MALGYRRVDRGQQFLLPPDVRDWLPDDHLVWLVLEMVSQLDTAAFHVRSRRGGVGREGFDPDMLLALVVYAVMRRVRSSREIERLCWTDVAFRVCCAQDAPDHSTLARFRQDHELALGELLAQVLVLCARAGLGRLGTVAVDGTKIAADASMDRSHSEVELRGMAERLVAEDVAGGPAEDAEYGSDRRGDEPPEELRGPARRAARIGELLADIDAEKQQASDAARDAASERATVRLGRAEARLVRERAVLAAHAEQRAAREAAGQAEASLRRREKEFKRNLTDLDSRLMPTRRGWVQGCNCQLAVSADHLIVATRVTQAQVDMAEFGPMLAAVAAAAVTITEAGGDSQAGLGVVLADAGYASVDSLTTPGPDRLIALGARRAVERDTAGRSGDTANVVQHPARQQMRERIRTPQVVELYRRRSATVEPVIGQLKDHLGLRRFSRRGLTAIRSELAFTAAVFQPAPPLPPHNRTGDLNQRSDRPFDSGYPTVSSRLRPPGRCSRPSSETQQALQRD